MGVSHMQHQSCMTPGMCPGIGLPGRLWVRASGSQQVLDEACTRYGGLQANAIDLMNCDHSNEVDVRPNRPEWCGA